MMWHRCLGVLALSLLALAVPGEAQTAKGKKYALLVGITDYTHSSLAKLKYTENDVEKLAKLFKQPGAGFADVRVLTTSRGKSNPADAPSGVNLKKALADLVAGKNRNDLILIALSGHGVTLEVEDPDGKGEAKSFVFFCPADADLVGVSYRTGTNKTLLNLNGVFATLGRSGAGTKLVLVDACRNELKAESSTRSIDPKQVTIPNGVGALFSCKAGQKAYEAEKLEHGVFFYHVLEGLKGKAKTEDNEVTWDSLGAYVRRTVTRVVPDLIGQGARQTPHAMTNIEGEPPVLLKVGKEVVSGKDRDKGKQKKDGDKPGPKKGGLPTASAGGGGTFEGMKGGGIKKVNDKGELIWSNKPPQAKAAGEPRAIVAVGKWVLLYQGSLLLGYDAATGKHLWNTEVALSATATITMTDAGNDEVQITDGTTTKFYDVRNGKFIR